MGSVDRVAFVTLADVSDRVERLLASPRGRFFCAHVAFACAAEQNPRGYPVAFAEVLAVIAGIDADRVADLSERELLDTLAFTTDCARYWQEPDEDDLIYAAPDVVEVLRPIAHAVLDSPELAWWGSAVDLHLQRRIGYPFPHRTFPVSTLPHRSADAGLEDWRTQTLAREAQARADRAGRAAAQISDQWWSTPGPSSSVETTRAHPEVGAIQVVAEEDTSIEDDVRIWPVTVAVRPRIYEITAPVDWAHLVATYPLEVTESKRWDWYRAVGEHRRWFIPDWAAVATDYDGVHLSVWGYLQTAGIAIPIDDHDAATVLAGWDPDATWWLNLAVIDIHDVPALWRRHDDHWTQSL